MIADCLEHADRYLVLHAGLRPAFDFLRQTGLERLPDGRIDLDGDRAYVLLQRYATHPPAEGRLEAHQRYLDVQCLLSGSERIGYAPVPAGRAVATPYDAGRDIGFYAGDCDFLTLRPGGFMLFWPWDGHMPGCHDGPPATVRKAVVKLRLPRPNP
jgi:YhcH/YjgK/YiaL family protein